MSFPTRRWVLCRGAQALAVLGLAPLLAERAAAATCSTDASESLRASLNYKEPSPVAAQTCSVCSFFTAAGACGSCSIMSDNVNPKGHCDSWAAKG
jgi:High potential iron-sulfur protein